MSHRQANASRHAENTEVFLAYVNWTNLAEVSQALNFERLRY